MRKFAIWLVALPLAAFAMSAAIGSATKLRAPEAAEQVWPTPGLTFERQARDSFTARVGESLTDIERAYRPADGRLARQAFAREPAAHFALALLALDASAAGDTERAREMFALLAGRDKRLPLVDLWRLFDFGAQERLAPMMASADRLFRYNLQARDRIMPGLAEATALPDAVPAIERELADNPAWSFQYWWALVRQPGSFDNAAILRERAHRRGLDVPPNFDRAFLFALANAGKLETAQSLAATLGDTEPARLTPDAPLEFDFTEVGGLPPFAWDVVSEGEFGGYLDPQLGELGVNAVARSGGIVGRRLLSFSPGRYNLSAQARLVNTSEPPVSISIRCADRARTRLLQLELEERNSTGTFTVPGNSCDYGWIEIEAEPVDDPEGYDVAVETIRFSPAS